MIAVSATAEHGAATPLGVPGDAWREVVARLAGAALVAEGTRTTTGVLAPLPDRAPSAPGTMPG